MDILALTASSGGTINSFFDQAASGLSWFFGSLSPAVVWAVLGIAVCAAFFVYYWWCLRPRPHSLEWVSMAEAAAEDRPMTLTLPHHKMTRRDVLPILLLTAVYAATAFFRLGSFTAPQSCQSFYQRETVAFELDREVTVGGLGWYSGIGTGDYSLELSADGRTWTALSVTDEVWEDGAWREKQPGEDTADKSTRLAYYWAESPSGGEGTVQSIRQGYSTVLKWQHITVEGGATVQARYFRLTGDPETAHLPMDLGELALYDGDGARLTVTARGADALFDEQDTVPEHSTYMDSAYFDEIYHPRTAYEHLRNIYPYEVSHPPLGKLIISLGILIFGMTPFGWRFMGTLFGVLMVPILYLFLKNLFGKTPVALCGTTLFTFDFMHLVQTRLATIDTYGVFFILVSYYFMYRWLAVPAGTKLRRHILPLFLSGLFWGIGCASKWTVVYAGVGLAVLWLLGMIFKGREWLKLSAAVWDEENQVLELPDVPRLSVHVAGTVALSVVFFVIVPLMIYTASYFPYASARGNDGNFGELAAEAALWLPQKLPGYLEEAAAAPEDHIKAFFDAIPTDSDDPVDIMMHNQYFMLTYHQGVHTPHPYASYWYQWIVDGRPILYYRDLDYQSVNGTKALFASFNNPLVSWTGLAAFFAVLIRTIRKKSGAGLFIVIAILSQFVPWLPIGRILFAYHYFPTILFLCFAITYLMNDMFERRRKGYRLAVYGLTGCVAGLYALFYPALIGLYTPVWYNDYFLRLFPSWPL